MIENYRFRAYGDYSPWPGPNSNTFVQAVLDAVPELKAVLPPTAIGKDYPYHGEWFGLTPSRTGMFVSLGGYLGLTVGWIEGIELNFCGGVRRPPSRPKVARTWRARPSADTVRFVPSMGSADQLPLWEELRTQVRHRAESEKCLQQKSQISRERMTAQCRRLDDQAHPDRLPAIQVVRTSRFVVNATMSA